MPKSLPPRRLATLRGERASASWNFCVWHFSNTEAPRRLQILYFGPSNMVFIVYIVLVVYILRAFGGRGPLCGTGVTSLIAVIWMPLVEKARIDDSRPAPTPETTTDTSFTPMAAARSPTSSPTLAASNGVPFLAPENPSEPDDDQVTMLPDLSPRHILVLLKVASTKSMPVSSLRLERGEDAAPAAPSPPPFLTIRFFPILNV